MKRCRKCDENKELTEFGKDSQKPDGLNVYCKICIRARSKNQREKNPDYYQEYFSQYREKNRENLRKKGRERLQSEPEKYNELKRESYHRHKKEISKRRKIKRLEPGYNEKESLRQKKWRDQNPDKYRAAIRKWQNENRIKCNAHAKVHRAVKFGKILKKEKCEMCGRKCQTEAYHEDYTKPLEVIWLCKECHGKTRHKVQV